LAATSDRATNSALGRETLAATKSSEANRVNTSDEKVMSPLVAHARVRAAPALVSTPEL
jgi:hypothetical protein